MAGKREKNDPFEELTWDDLHKWAGSTIVSRGQSYQRNRHVQGLARTPSGGLVAWVQGMERYTTRVDFDHGELTSACTCPYGGTCKHAVAVVLEYLDHLKRNVAIPQVSAQDQRLKMLEKYGEEEGWNEEDDEGSGEDDEELAINYPAPRKSKKETPENLPAFLEQQTKEQLVALMKELAESNPIVREALQDRRDLSQGTVKEIVRSVRREIQELSSEPGWKNSWNDEGYIPDYSRVKERLEALLSQGYADEVISLGKELLKAGRRQVEMSHDEGETATEISSCLEVVFRALPQSSMPPAEQMLWAVEAELEDEYELCHGVEFFWEQEHAVANWNILANKLLVRLNDFHLEKRGDSFSRNYRRDHLSNWVIRALENAGRREEIIILCEREAEKTGSYPRLVNALREANRFEEAEQWIHKGIKATWKQWPGIASELRATLREMREKDGDWLRVAAFRAEDFFQAPTLDTFKELEKASKRAKVWTEVEPAARQYLETGKLPKTASSWPLPETGVMKISEQRQSQIPVIETLIDIAIAEKRPDDVIRWYDRRKPKKVSWGLGDFQEDEIAKALADQYPDRALTIWKKLAENLISLTKPKAYEEAANYLRKIQRLLKKLKREKDWQSYLAVLRRANEKKRKLLEILNRLEGRRIVEGA